MSVTLNYKPDLKVLAVKFRPWQVEALLNQCADLVDKCLEELREYNSLNYGWESFAIDQEFQETEVVFNERRTLASEKDRTTAQSRQRYFTNSQEQFDRSVTHAGQAWQKDKGEKDDKVLPSQIARSAQALNEKRVERSAREESKALNAEQLTWSQTDNDADVALRAARRSAVEARRRMASAGNALDLDYQRKLVLNRVIRNYRDALNRAVVAADGLSTIYPSFSSGINIDGPTATLHEGVSILSEWVRTAIEWLVAYHQLDQSFTQVLSMRWLLKNEWNALKSAQDMYKTTFPIPAKHFETHLNVRFRGVAAAFIGDVGTIPWTLQLRLPKTALYQRSPTNLASVDQSNLPGCVLGRVESRTVARAPEVCGSVSLINASPLGAPGAQGDWTFALLRPSRQTEEFGRIEDVLLELYLVGQPLRLIGE